MGDTPAAQGRTRLIFGHIPKTAGSSFHGNLSDILRAAGIRPTVAYRANGVPPDGFPTYDLPEDWRFLAGMPDAPLLRRADIADRQSRRLYRKHARDKALYDQVRAAGRLTALPSAGVFRRARATLRSRIVSPQSRR